MEIEMEFEVSNRSQSFPDKQPSKYFETTNQDPTNAN